MCVCTRFPLGVCCVASTPRLECALRTPQVIGTPMWMSPEMIEVGQYDHRTDIWSLGITAIELAQLTPPLFDITPVVRVLFLIPSRPAPTLDEPDKWTRTFCEFLAACLSKDPSMRLEAAGAREQ